MTHCNVPFRRELCAGHSVRSVIAAGEPMQHRNRALSDLAAALPTPAALGNHEASVEAVATTPDFHPGKPVPVGVVADVRGAVLPHMIGNDIGCGMRMIVLDGVGEDDLSPKLDRVLRHKFFQGGRDIALSGTSRHALLREGLPGLLETIDRKRAGLLAALDMSAAWSDLDRTSDAGAFATTHIDPGFREYAELRDDLRRDAILGSIGGGNHFVEFGIVDRVEDPRLAYEYRLKPGSVVIVAHSGSLDFGQHVGSTTAELLRRDCRPGDDWRILSEASSIPYERYLNGQANAVNAAFGNRFLIGLTAVAALSECLNRPISHRLVYDAPHNAIWRTGSLARHRKGACPAAPDEPVILPGSMGDGTWLLTGLGSQEGLASAAHGAGRRLSRQEARSVAAIDPFLRIVGPVDSSEQRVRSRPDLLRELAGRLKEESPAAYRPIETVVDPMVDAGLVSRVAKIRPVLTVKA